MYRYPIEVISDIYLSRVGGFSYELSEREVGINHKAIELKTSLIPNETFVTLRFLDKKAKPYFFRKRFLVVGIEEQMDSYEMTSNGELVLPESFKEEAEIGKEVIINAVEFFRIDRDLAAVFEALILRLRSKNEEN
ncbi:MAG: hypothetical protein QXI54_09140 [Archaeoglobaceae archaeon]